jgi:hypothetical protein
MRKKIPVSIIFLLLLLTINLPSYTQEDKSGPFTPGADLCSSFIWRGMKNGTGPAIQPVMEFTTGSFTTGAWGSFDFHGYQEVDLYIKASLPSGLFLGLTDYYSPDLKYFDYSRESGSHAFEFTIGFLKNNFSLEADYIVNKAGGIGSAGDDIYIQAGYSFDLFTLFAGAGNGWLTYDPVDEMSRFRLCNTGIEVSRTITITETFEIPLTGQLIFNPDRQQLFIVFCVSL